MSRRPRSVQASLAQIILGFEVVVVGLGSLVTFGLGVLPPALALGGGGGLVALMFITIALVSRFRWAFVLGWFVQLLVVASGFILQMMFLIGIVFTALWMYGMITGTRLDAQKANNS